MTEYPGIYNRVCWKALWQSCAVCYIWHNTDIARIKIRFIDSVHESLRFGAVVSTISIYSSLVTHIIIIIGPLKKKTQIMESQCIIRAFCLYCARLHVNDSSTVNITVLAQLPGRKGMVENDKNIWWPCTVLRWLSRLQGPVLLTWINFYPCMDE